ncbi:hypothetical protein BW731_01935 [Vagococcus martis]|uniref:MFS transporter n=1 Tax=Vagococcus martis TaxID=1768210 RepID=A0A1V4DET5_9ENTE|nr:hypothetical protein [Vagococcus martis]OPF87049.1 hypothetical protein BW731_01935 [Vagococcus martis]
MENIKKRFESLQFIPFVLVNGMNLFPIFILVHVFLQHNREFSYLLPLLFFYCFKTTILFLIRLKTLPMKKLLPVSIVIGIIGCVFGLFINQSIIFGWIAGSLLGMCSGLMFPSYTTVMFHERSLNEFKGSSQLYSLGYALVFSAALFKLIDVSMVETFLFLGLNLILLYSVISTYPDYTIDETIPYPNYSTIETLVLFFVGFFTVFIIKGDKKLGVTNFLISLMLIMLVLLVIYFVYYKKITRQRQFKPLESALMIYKGMLTNFILVFCTLYQMINHGKSSLMIVYSLYLTSIIISPMIGKKIKNKQHVIVYGLVISFLLLSTHQLFYIGVLTLSITTSIYNQQLNQAVYQYPVLPRDFRLIAKYRLGNIGSIVHQLVMMAVLLIVTNTSHKVSLDNILHSYSFKEIDTKAIEVLDVSKYSILMIFIVILVFLYRGQKKEAIFSK